MGAIVLADPGPPGRARDRRRYAVPALLVAGWAGLFAYAAFYLTDDMPFRAGEGVRPVEAAPARAGEDGPRRIVVVAPVEAPAVVAPMVVAPTVITPPPARPTAAPGAVVAAPIPPAPRPAPAADYVGIWGPTAEACAAPSRRRGFIQAAITPDGARAGRTLCTFRDTRRAGSAWTMAAECSDRGRRWSSQVRLVVDGDRLTWSSSRGASAYVRCPRRAG